MKPISELIQKTNKPISERTYWIQQIADSIGVPFNNIFREVFHLKGKVGNMILHGILEDVLMQGANMNFRSRKLRELINKSKPPTPLKK